MPSQTLISVVGARPQFVKLAPMIKSIGKLAPHWDHRIVHTGQHYDYEMSAVFFKDLGIPAPDVNLNIGSGKQGRTTAAMITELEPVFEDALPDGVIVYGDTNSTLAATIAASKLNIPQFHVEAGLRSFDRHMPEEINRIVADHCAEILFAPTATALLNLKHEGLEARAMNVGDIMFDLVLQNSDRVTNFSDVLSRLELRSGDYALATVHRASNTEPDVLAKLLDTLSVLSGEFLPVVFPMHPRTRSLLHLLPGQVRDGLRIVEPQPYIDMLSLVKNARFVMTDSGGLQKEAAFLGTPCVTLRDTTEWWETVEIGANRLAGLEMESVRDAVRGIIDGPSVDWSGNLSGLYGDGDAAAKIVTAIANWLSKPRDS